MKPENILIDQNFNLKIADFGYSEEFSEKMTCFCGTRGYMAPEIESGIPYSGDKVDIFASAIVLY